MSKNITVPHQSGNNSQVSINNAINSVSSSGGGTVTLAPGTFIISSPVYMKSNVTLQGTLTDSDDYTNKNRYQSIIKLIPGAAFISGGYWYITSSLRHVGHGIQIPRHSLILSLPTQNNVTICNLGIDPSVDSHHSSSGSELISHGSGFFNCIEFDYGSNLCVHDVYIGYNKYGGFGDGISSHFVTSGYFKVYNLIIASPGQGHDGVYILRNPNTQIYNCEIAAAVNSAIRCAESTAEIYNNHLYGAKWNNPGLQLDHNYADYIANYNVHGNVIEGMGGPGIQCTALCSTTSERHSIIIHHNIIRKNGYYTDTEQVAGIHIGGQPNVHIYDNTIDSNIGHGIILMGTARKNPGSYGGYGSGHVIYVSNNIISNTTRHTKWTGMGIGIADYLSNSSFVITDNIFYSNDGGDYLNTSLSSGNGNTDPKFVDLSDKDYHLKSKFGSFHNDRNAWVKDSINSPCIRFDDGTECGRYNATPQQSRQKDVVDTPTIPVADFSISPGSGTAPLKVNFTDESTGTITKRHWNFGDGETVDKSNSDSFGHTYSDSGKYTASLTVSNSAGSNTKTLNITVNEPPVTVAPVANFIADPVTGESPLTVHFADKSLGTISNRHWILGDNTEFDTDVAKSFNHLYTTYGTYPVSLIVENSMGTDTKTINIVVKNPPPIIIPPVADFTADPTSGNYPLTVHFKDISTGVISGWHWDLGDGSSFDRQELASFDHTYTSPGTYTVTLTIANVSGNDTKSITITVTETESTVTAPVADFTATPVTGDAPLNVYFTGKSTGTITIWHWDFGDGSSSDGQQSTAFYHTYTSPGTYTASLTVANNVGKDVKTTKITVNKQPPKIVIPTADFIADIVKGEVPLTVQFTDKSTDIDTDTLINKPNSWSWDFGDGTSSTEQSPKHTYYVSGLYTVKLTVSNTAGKNTYARNGYITASPFEPFTQVTYNNRLKNPYVDTSFPSNTYIDIGSTIESMSKSLTWYDLENPVESVSRSLLWFNIDKYIGKQITKAVLRLYWFFPQFIRENDTVLEVYRPSVVWDPENVTWNSNVPALKQNWKHPGGDWYDSGGIVQGTRPYSTMTFSKNDLATLEYYEIDVTKLVQEYLNGKYNNYGFLLKSKNESEDYIAFYSFLCGSDLASPQLIISEAGIKPVKQTIYLSGDDSGDYRCDGINDHIQINQALKQVYDNPDLYAGVYLKGPFTYIIDETLLIGGSCTLSGDSTAIVKLKDDCLWPADQPLIKERAANSSTVEVSNITIDGNRSNQHDSTGNSIMSGKGYHNLIHFTKVSDISIHDLYLTNNHGDGLKVINCANVKFYNNTVYSPGHDAFFSSGTDTVTAWNNTITCRNNSGLRIYNTNHVKFYENTITAATSGVAGIDIQKFGTYGMNDIEIYNNTIYKTALYGIWCYSASSYKASTSMINIHHNIIYDIGIKKTYDCGGIILNGFNALIENNVLDGCYRSGIYFKNIYSETPVITGTLTATVRNNIIIGTLAGYGIVKNSTATNLDVVLQNNCLYSNESGSVHGIDIPTGDTANISVNPLFVDQENHNYYLKSIAGRYDKITTKWTVDDVNSPCIDAGYSGSDYSKEPTPNGSRINIGRYGGTEYASLTGNVHIVMNHAPVLDPIPNKTIEIEKKIEFTVTATDPENDTLTYSSSILPSGATFNKTTGAFSWTPGSNQEGTYSITFTVSDGILTDSQEMKIGVVKQIIQSFVNNNIYGCRLKESIPTQVTTLPVYIDAGGRSGIGAYRSLLTFDMSKYYDKTITSAIFSLYWFYPDGKERTNATVVEIYSPLPWDMKYVSWNQRTQAATWAHPGGDWYDLNQNLNGSTPFAALTLNADTVPINGYINFDVTTLIQAYANKSLSSTGFLIKAKNESDNYLAFYNAVIGVNGLTPKLEIQYTT